MSHDELGNYRRRIAFELIEKAQSNLISNEWNPQVQMLYTRGFVLAAEYLLEAVPGTLKDNGDGTVYYKGLHE